MATTVDATSESLADASGRYLLDVDAKRDPYAFLNRLRDTEPVHRSAAGPWLVSSYELAVIALRDRRLSRSAATPNDIDVLFAPSPATDVYAHKMVNREGPDHLRLRRLLAATFSPAGVQPWKPKIEAQLDELIDAVEPNGQADFVRDLAYPVPEHVICTMLDVPASDHTRFEHWAQVLNARPHAGTGSDQQRVVATAALEDFVGYLRDLVARRRQAPGDDLVSQLIAVEEGGDRLSDIELTAVLMEVINGGHDTTANVLANAALVLLQEPARWRMLADDPSIVPTAVEEILRMRSAVQLTLVRTATEDVELGGVTIPNGDTVIVCLAAANRQPDHFSEPDRLDLERQENRHLAFATGRHVCLGAHLARLELDVALDRLVRRLPTMELAVPVEDLPWRTTTLVMAPSAIPVRWT